MLFYYVSLLHGLCLFPPPDIYRKAAISEDSLQGKSSGTVCGAAPKYKCVLVEWLGVEKYSVGMYLLGKVF